MDISRRDFIRVSAGTGGAAALGGLVGLGADLAPTLAAAAEPRSPHNEGTLCPKGAAIYQLHVNPNRPTKVLHRAPGAADWEVWDLERAMSRVAELVKKSRDETFIEQLESGARVNMTPAIFSLGGATLDNEWNHIQQKLMRGLGIVAIENQARI